MKTAKLIIIGFGVIGKGFVRVLIMKHNEILKNHDIDLKVVAICEIDGSLVNEKGIDLESALKLAEKEELKKHNDWRSIKGLEVIEEIDADIVLELTPGNIKSGEPGLSHIICALKNGRHVVTSNKAPLALRFSQLHKLAEKRGVKLRYEASVGGAIPIINLYRNNMQINRIHSIYGILNGTSNFILTKMFEEDLALDIALKEAQEIGIAEKDPSYDINGIDTGVKLVILANSLMDKKISFRDVKITGIKEVTPESVELAKNHGFVIKLIGDVNKLEVSPRLVPLDHPLNVSGTLNAIMLDTDIAGSIILVGHGAGKIETASSLFSDVLDILRS